MVSISAIYRYIKQLWSARGKEPYGDEKEMIDKTRLTKQLIIHEGLKLEPYQCTAGKLTIGVGRNLDDVGITKEEATYMLENDIARVAGQCWANFEWFAQNPSKMDCLLNHSFVENYKSLIIKLSFAVVNNLISRFQNLN